jgi:hypothetical protein
LPVVEDRQQTNLFQSMSELDVIFRIETQTGRKIPPTSTLP